MPYGSIVSQISGNNDRECKDYLFLFSGRPKCAESRGRIYRFEDCAAVYLLGSAKIQDKLHACHPVIVRLYLSGDAHERELYQTLKIFLDNDRSFAKTAAILYTHRNTVFYRIRSCTALLENDLSDPSVRLYLRLSMLFLEENAGRSEKTVSL